MKTVSALKIYYRNAVLFNSLHRKGTISSEANSVQLQRELINFCVNCTVCLLSLKRTVELNARTHTRLYVCCLVHKNLKTVCMDECHPRALVNLQLLQLQTLGRIQKVIKTWGRGCLNSAWHIGYVSNLGNEACC